MLLWVGHRVELLDWGYNLAPVWGLLFELSFPPFSNLMYAVTPYTLDCVLIYFLYSRITPLLFLFIEDARCIVETVILLLRFVQEINERS